MSGVARYLRGYGRMARIEYAKMLLGDAKTAVAFDYPRHLCRAAAGLANRRGASVQQLLFGHTFLPLHRPFLRDVHWRQVVIRALRDDHIHFILGIGPSRISQPRYLRRCRSCIAGDTVRTGQPYWHRIHHLPGALVCAEHGEPLEETTVLSHRNAAFELVAAQDSRAQKTIMLTGREKRVLQRVAIDLASLLANDAPISTPEALALVYRACLKAKGWLTPSGRIDQERLCHAFTGHFGSPLLHRLDCSIAPTRRDHWLARLLYGRYGHQSPLRHVLLACFLKTPVVGLISQASKEIGQKEFANQPKPRAAKISCTLAEMEEKQQRWLAIRATETGNLRKRYDNLYSWLWRNCPAWLAESCQISAQQMTLTLNHRRSLDERLSGEISSAREAALIENPEARLSIRRLAEKTSRPNIVISHDQAFPEVRAALERAVEVTDTCAIRKIKIAAFKFRARRRLERWRLIRSAGLAKTTTERPRVAQAINKELR